MNTKIIMIIYIALAMSISSCKDACKNKCQNGSACVDGNCVCDSLHTGQYCELQTCDVNHTGYIKTRASYYGYFYIYFSDINDNPLNLSQNLAYHPGLDLFDTIIVTEVPAQCYKLSVIHWDAVPGTPADHCLTCILV